MNSTFMGLAIATRGLYASQAGLSVTSHNISNLNTDGYSRQTVNQTAAGPAAVYNGRSLIGAGAQVNSVGRTRDARLDQKYWQENGSLGEWETKADSLTEMESIVGEPSDNGFSTIMSDFYSAMEDLADDPSSSSARANVKETGVSVCEYLNNTAERLTQLRDDDNGNIKTTVDQINSCTEQIADLNRQIRQASLTGAATNDLEDQRGVIIDQLSKLTQVEVKETTASTQSDGTEVDDLSISVNGVALVNGSQSRKLECYEIQDGSAQNGMYGIRWQDTGDMFTSTGGELKAYLDLRDGTGSGSAYKGIPYYSSQLDDFARTFAKAFNEGIFKDGTTYYSGHAGGLGANGSSDIRFFSFDNKSSSDLMASGADTTAVYDNITASNISLSQDVQDDIDKIAAASTTGGSENNENINGLISLCKDTKMFNQGTPEDAMNAVIATLGTASSYAQSRSDSQSSMVKSINSRRTSVSGVSSNEETANLTKYEQAYTASAKMINTWDTIYQETINLLSDS